MCHKYDRKVRRTEPRSEDIYLRLRTNSNFNKVVSKRLFMSRTNRRPLSVSKLLRKMKKPGRDNKIAVVVGTITDDIHIHSLPKLKMCALKITDCAGGRILKAGGKILTFDQLAISPGVPHSHTKPIVRSKCHTFERARGHRKSR
ncbi:unnamed protein product [Candidula unifasciata]|uniref:Large ribosomal subunit protein uL15/eL18 domain-containing protein n=1 Tax=Candidula unifasciata TaxID=100452 RepID=A0A8S3YU40_9EUPU|nr:unnamed protein product [Candidula unifasciata]